MASLGMRPSIDHLRDPAVFIKIPEIILLIIALSTYGAYGTAIPAYGLAVMLPCLINSVVFMTVYILGYNQLRQTPVELALYTYSVISLFICSILLMSRSLSTLIASGVFCLFLTFVYCAEVYFSYINLVNRSSASPNTEAAPAEGQQPAGGQQATVGQQPAVISSPDSGGTYPNMAPIAHHVASGIDLGFSTVNLSGPHHTNPTYPTTMNYPPHPLPTTKSTEPTEVQEKKESPVP